MFCPNCAMENVDTALECRRCHVPFHDEEHAPEAAHAEAPARGSRAEQNASSSEDLGEVCRRCETYNPPGTKRCENCGYKLFADAAPEASAHSGSPSAREVPHHETVHVEPPHAAHEHTREEAHVAHQDPDKTPPTGFQRTTFGEEEDASTRAEPPPNFDKTPPEPHPSLSDELSALALSDEDARAAFGNTPPADATPPDGVPPVVHHEPEPARPAAKARPAAAPVPAPPPPTPPAPPPQVVAAPPAPPPPPPPPVAAKPPKKAEEVSTDPSSGKVRSARGLDSTAEQPPISLEHHLALSVAPDPELHAEPPHEAVHEEAHAHALHDPSLEAHAAPPPPPAEEGVLEAAPEEWADAPADAVEVAEATPEPLPEDATPPQGEPPLAEEALASGHQALPDETPRGFDSGEEPTNIEVAAEPTPTDEVLAAEPEPEFAPAPEPEPPYQVTVVVEKGSSAGTAFMLGRLENAIGSTSAAIEIPEDPHLAPLHASLLFDDQRLLLRDGGAANGVYLKLKEAAQLVPGDLFIAGERLLRFDGPIEIPLADETDTPFHGAPRPPAPAVRVTEVLFGGKTGRTCHRAGPVIAVGKTGCDLNFPADTLLAARHAEIHLAEDGSASLLDVAGQGVLLRVRPQETHELFAGDVLQVGDQVLRIEVG